VGQNKILQVIVKSLALNYYTYN